VMFKVWFISWKTATSFTSDERTHLLLGVCEKLGAQGALVVVLSRHAKSSSTF
jgi:hypothetical protein